MRKKQKKKKVRMQSCAETIDRSIRNLLSITFLFENQKLGYSIFTTQISNVNILFRREKKLIEMKAQ